ncbi:MAG: PaaI family thioesterase [Actinobacteria bacterium]|nr:PaaI family thioesterase [Actinomycetota bacterium]
MTHPEKPLVGVPGDPAGFEPVLGPRERERLRGRGEPPPADGPPQPLPSHYSHCFGCGVEHPTGLHMRMAGAGLKVVGSFEVTEHHQGAPALAHGGVIAAAMDEAMGFLLWLLQTLAVTAHLEVDFKRPVPVGATLELQGEVERTEGRKIFARMQGRVNGEVAVEARALFLKVQVKHFAPYAKEAAERPTYNP